jgi:hypothetical protein
VLAAVDDRAADEHLTDPEDVAEVRFEDNGLLSYVARGEVGL